MTVADQNTTAGVIQEYEAVVVQAARNVMQMTCGAELQPCEPTDDLTHQGVIVAVIGFVGQVEMSVFLGLPKATAVASAMTFAGFEIPFESPDMGDAIGELTNIFAGEVKALLDAQGIEVNISLPSVMRAESIEMLIQRSNSSEKKCFECSLGKLWTGLSANKTPEFMV